VLTYDYEFFQRFEPLSVGEMLKRLPSITFASDVLEYDAVSVRGLPPGYTQILINGRRAPDGQGQPFEQFGSGFQLFPHADDVDLPEIPSQRRSQAALLGRSGAGDSEAPGVGTPDGVSVQYNLEAGAEAAGIDFSQYCDAGVHLTPENLECDRIADLEARALRQIAREGDLGRAGMVARPPAARDDIGVARGGGQSRQQDVLVEGPALVAADPVEIDGLAVEAGDPACDQRRAEVAVRSGRVHDPGDHGVEGQAAFAGDFGKDNGRRGLRGDIGDLRYFRGDRSFGAFSGAVGASYGLSDAVRIGLNLSRTERAPSAEELFSNGAHAGTQAYELGNPDFRLEKSWGLEATFHAHGDGYSFDASAYYNWFSNFISDNQTDQAVCEAAAAPSGRDVDLPCFQLTQGDARYYGFEASGSVKVAQLGSYAINVDALGDYVNATLTNRGPAPRIPPARVLAGVEAQSDRLSGRIEVEHVFPQGRLAPFETRTREFTLVNFSAQFKPFSDRQTTFTLSANNLFDVDARRHASFLKDFAPLAGRDIRLTVRFGI